MLRVAKKGAFLVPLLVIGLVVGVITPVSSAISVQQQQLMKNGVRYFDIATSDDTTTCATGSDSLGTGSNEKNIWDWLIEKGMTEKGTAGIMGNMSVESGFNPFRIQVGAPLRTYDTMVKSNASNSAFGLVQWDGSRRQQVLQVLSGKNDEYKQYVADKYGKDVGDFSNAPREVTDDFILTELDFMHKESTPGGGRATTWSALLSADSPEAAADVFEEIFEGSKRTGGGPHTTEARRIYDKYKGSASEAGGTSDCGGGTAGLVSGGMNVEQAKAFMQNYINYAKGKSGSGLKSASYNGRSFQLYYSGCPGGPLANCSTFSEFFVGAYTRGKQAFPNGKLMVGELLATHSGFVDGGHTPKVYAVFSRASGGGGFGHTGVILGIDKENNKIIIGQASCGQSLTMDVAVEVGVLSEWTGNSDYTYAYTDNIILKGL